PPPTRRGLPGASSNSTRPYSELSITSEVMVVVTSVDPSGRVLFDDAPGSPRLVGGGKAMAQGVEIPGGYADISVPLLHDLSHRTAFITFGMQAVLTTPESAADAAW